MNNANIEKKRKEKKRKEKKNKLLDFYLNNHKKTDLI